jgi:predicted RNase H-like HicB family nuclease
MMLDRYDVMISWSSADGVFIADVPALEGCMVHGDTRAEALANAEQAIAAWIATAKEFGDPIPEPGGRTGIAA